MSRRDMAPEAFRSALARAGWTQVPGLVAWGHPLVDGPQRPVLRSNGSFWRTGTVREFAQRLREARKRQKGTSS